MSGTKSPQGGISRRSFLKTTGAVAGAAAVAGGGMTIGLTALAENNSQSSQEEQVFTGVCRGNCAGGCFLNVFVRDGKVVRTSAREMPDEQYTRICSKGLTQLYRMYNEYRVRYPMRRIGDRGSEDSFERISWDEAIKEISGRWTDLTDKYGKGAVAFYWGSGQFGTANGCRTNDIWNRFMNAAGVGKINRSVDIAHAHSLYAVVGKGKFQTNNEPTDFKNSKVLFVWGANPSISQIHTTHFILEAKETGTKLIVVDPVYNTMASKADVYVPVKAGTDGALALGMAKYIIDQGWENLDFIKKYTVAPYLVKSSDGKLKQSDLGIVSESGKDSPIVMGADGAFGTEDEIVDPLIEGTFSVNGIEVSTAYSLVLKGINDYSLARTSELTGVSEAQIKEIAEIYANEGPCNIYTAFGLNHYVNGHYNFFCLALLPAITGNIGKPGAGIGLNECYYYEGNPLCGKPKGVPGASLDVTNLKMDEIVATGKFGSKDAVIKGVVFVGCNAMTNGVERNNTKSWLETMDLIVSVDLNFNENALMADYILPAAHWFEEEDIFCLYAAHPYMLHQEKAAEPLFEAKTDFEIASLLAHALGVGEYFEMTDQDYLKEWLDTDIARENGLTYEKLCDQGALRMISEDSYVYALGNKFSVGRIKIYQETAKPEYNWGQQIDMSKEHVPYWEEPNEVKAHSELREKYPFHMLSDHSRFHTHSQWWEAQPLVELAGGEPILKINPHDAEQYDIENGDLVKVFNDRGYVVMRAFKNGGLPSGMLSAPKGWERRQYVDGHFSSLTSKVVNPACTNAAFNDVLVGIEKY